MFIHIIYFLWYNLAESSIENFINYFSVKLITETSDHFTNQSGFE